jgi:signal transduction histidine kinase
MPGGAIERPSGGKGSTNLRAWLVPGAALVCWAAVLSVALFGAGGGASGWSLAVAAVYAPASLFCAWSFSAVCMRATGTEQMFWGVLGAGVLLYLAGSPLWSPARGPGSWATTLCYAASNALLFGALYLLLQKVSRRAAYVAWLDVLAVALSVGVLLSYFVATPAELTADASSWRVGMVVFFAQVLGAGLLYLSLLLVGVDGSPDFSKPVALGFLALFAAKGVYLIASDISGLPEPRFWLQLLWTAGLLLLAAAAWRSSPVDFEGSPWELGTSPSKQAAFWFGPLSPAMHFAAVFAWAALRGPVPGYLAAGGAAFALYCGSRFALYSRAVHRMRLWRDEAVGRLEQGRISEELHDTLKQSVYSTSLLLHSYKKAREKRGEEAAEEVLERAIAASREANHNVSRPIEELRMRGGADVPDPIRLLRQIRKDLCNTFHVRIHEDFRANLGNLGVCQLAAIHRIASEALWNAAKHAKATNIWLESRAAGQKIVVRVRDDGRGMPDRNTEAGFGIPLMQMRAEEAGGSLRIISEPDAGTIVEVRFERQ